LAWILAGLSLAIEAALKQALLDIVPSGIVTAEIGRFLLETLLGVRVVVASGAREGEASRFRACMPRG
jgi:hypothetical protein